MHQVVDVPIYECPGAECSMCNGDLCTACGVGLERGDARCDHECIERHERVDGTGEG